MNWQRHHTRDNANCIISIYDEDKGCWVDKEDVGTESNTEAQKGLASDSFKRAGSNGASEANSTPPRLSGLQKRIAISKKAAESWSAMTGSR
jgi:hypothetical protein